jgi:hypothetical protein
MCGWIIQSSLQAAACADDLALLNNERREWTSMLLTQTLTANLNRARHKFLRGHRKPPVPAGLGTVNIAVNFPDAIFNDGAPKLFVSLMVRRSERLTESKIQAAHPSQAFHFRPRRRRMTKRSVRLFSWGERSSAKHD